LLKNWIQKIFGKAEEPEAFDARTGELVTAPLSALELELQPLATSAFKPVSIPPAGHLEPAQLIVGSCQSVGRQRDQNQDSVYTFAATLAGNNNQLPFGLFIVADGMGGHEHGELASEAGMRVMAEYILRNLYLPLLGFHENAPNLSLQEVMQRGVSEAHQAILKKTPDGGTTLTAALVLGRQVTTAHVGDSRAYLVDAAGRLHQLTRDHTVVRRLEEMGQLTALEAAVHPQRNVLYRALGQGEPIEAEVQTHRLPPAGYIMICSDGLWGVVPENEITQAIAQQQPPHLICQALVQTANEKGGPDNISVILVRIPE
jgi:serine/threonine protein phosphatase PrpC